MNVCVMNNDNYVITQVIHNLSMWSANDKTLSYDQVKKDANKAKKDLKMVRHYQYHKIS